MEKFELVKKIKESGSGTDSIFIVTLMSQAKGVDHHIDIPINKWVLPAGICRGVAIKMAENIALTIAKRLRAKMSKQVLLALTNGVSVTDPEVEERIRVSQIRGLDVLRLAGLSIEIEELTIPRSVDNILVDIYSMNFNNLYDTFS